MTRNMEIDFIRQAIYQTILQEYIKNHNDYVGSPNNFGLHSFYEHLKSDIEVDRYVENVRQLLDQQNRTELIANGVIVAPTSPTITNLNQVDIVPMEFSCTFRTTIENIEKVKDTLDNMVSILKGRKVDIAELDSGELFMVGTIANNSKGTPKVKNGDYIGDLPSGGNLTTFINGKYTDLSSIGLVFENYNNGFILGSYFYFKDNDGKLKVAIYKYDEEHEIYIWSSQEQTNDYPDIIFPPEHNSFTKWSLSITFDSFRLSEPREINATDYIDLIFGGSATLGSYGVVFGNELTKLGIKRLKAITSDSETFDSGIIDTDYTWLEPLEMPSGNNAETMVNQLTSNAFKNNSHTNSITLTNQYTFVLDRNINLLKYFFRYARYGIQKEITPNLIYGVRELWSYWGNVEINGEIDKTYIADFKAKIIESIDIENTESDTLTITLPMQIQGDNN